MNILDQKIKQDLDLLKEIMTEHFTEALHQMGEKAKELSFFCEVENVEESRKAA